MTSLGALRRKAKDVERRASAPGGIGVRCSVPGCRRPTQRSSGKGLSETHCKAHQEFYRRHGSYWKRSYLAHELEPYRKAARRWLKACEADPEVQAALFKLDWLISSSGRSESAYSLKGRSAKERARIALARLREAGKRGEDLFLIALTIKAITSDKGPRGDPEFTHVHIAKMAHRLASGTHRTTSGFPLPSKYPRAEGLFMRILGEQIKQRADIAADRQAVQDVIAMARKEQTQ